MVILYATFMHRYISLPPNSLDLTNYAGKMALLNMRWTQDDPLGTVVYQTSFFKLVEFSYATVTKSLKEPLHGWGYCQQ